MSVLKYVRESLNAVDSAQIRGANKLTTAGLTDHLSTDIKQKTNSLQCHRVVFPIDGKQTINIFLKVLVILPDFRETLSLS